MKNNTFTKENLKNKQSHGHLDDYYVPNIRVNIIIQLSQIIGPLLFGNTRFKIDLFIFSSISKNSSFISLNIIIICIFKYFVIYYRQVTMKSEKRGFSELFISLFAQRAKKSRVIKQKLLKI